MLLDSISDAVIGVDQDQRIVFFNGAAENMFEIGAEDALGQALSEIPSTRLLARIAQRTPGSGSSTVFDKVILPSGNVCRTKLVADDQGVRFIILEEFATADDSKGWLTFLVDESVHDMKNRITSIKGSVDLINEIGNLNMFQNDAVKRALHGLETAYGQATELMDMVWLASGDELNLCEVDLNELARRVVTQRKSYAQLQNVELKLELAHDVCNIEGDARRLEGAINNLIGNAIKYSPDGGPVSLGVYSENGSAYVRVQDWGIGIDPEHLPHVFDRFYRVRSPETRGIEGTGLGLSIVKEVVAKHGGSVSVTSALGEGSTFEVSLPLTPSH